MPVSDAELEAVASGQSSVTPPPTIAGTGPSDVDLEAIASGRPVAPVKASDSELSSVASGTHPDGNQSSLWDRLNDFGRFIKAAPEAAGKIAEAYTQGSFPPIPLPKGWTADSVSTLVGIPVGLLDFLTSSKMQPTNLGNLLEAGQQAVEMTGAPAVAEQAMHPAETLQRFKEKPFSTAMPAVQLAATVAGGMKMLGQATRSAELPPDVAPTALPTPPPLERRAPVSPEAAALPRERRGQVQAPPGTRDLEFTDTGDLKAGPLKTGEILWQDRGELKSGKYAGQAPGPAGSTLLKVTDEAGKERFFQVREGESRVMVRPKTEEPSLGDQAANRAGLEKQVYGNLEDQGLGGQKRLPMRTRKQMTEEIVPELEKRGFVPGKKEPVPSWVTETTPEAIAGEAGAFERAIAEEHPKAAPEAVGRAAAIRSEPLPQDAAMQGSVAPPGGGGPPLEGTPLRPGGGRYGAPGVISDLLGRLSDKFGLRPKYFREFEKLPDLAEAVPRAMNANLWLDQQRKVWTEESHRAVPKEADRIEGMRFLVSERGKALPGSKIPTMTAQEEAALSPGARKFVAWWMNEFQPFFEKLSTGAGIKTRVETGSGGFTSLKALRPEDLPSAGGAHVVGYEPGRTGNVVAKYRKLTSQAAKQAKGTGDFYSVDPDEMISHNLGLRTTQYARNKLVETVKKYEVQPDAEGNVPRETKFLGRLEPVVNLEIEPPLTNLMTPEGSPVVGRIAKAPIKVPATVKRMYDDAVALPSQDKLAAFDYLNRKATTVALISPVEMATHTYNVINALTTMPGGLGSKALAVLGPPGKWAEAIAKVGNVNDAGYVKDLMTLTEYGGSRRGLMVANQTGKVLEGVRAPVFGTRGVENLSRVTALRGLREFAPELNDAQRMQIINNVMGTYAEKLQPGLVKGLKRIPLVGQPFAAAGVAMAKTAGKTLLGLGARGFSPEVAITAGSSIALWYAANKALDPQHRDPMRLGGPTFPSVRVSTSPSRTIDVSIPMLTGFTGRGARVLGLTGLYEGIRDKRSPQDTATLMLRNLQNTALQLAIGPAGTILSEATTGYRPYMTRGGSFLKVADTSKENQLLENLKSGAKGAGVWRAIPEEGTLTPETVAGKTAAIFGQLAAIPVATKPSEEVLATYGIRAGRGDIYETARDIAQKANNFPDPEKRWGYIESRLYRDLKGDDRAVGRKAVVQIMKSMLRSQGRALGQLPEK